MTRVGIQRTKYLIPDITHTHVCLRIFISFLIMGESANDLLLSSMLLLFLCSSGRTRLTMQRWKLCFSGSLYDRRSSCVHSIIIRGRQQRVNRTSKGVGCLNDFDSCCVYVSIHLSLSICMILCMIYISPSNISLSPSSSVSIIYIYTHL